MNDSSPIGIRIERRAMLGVMAFSAHRIGDWFQRLGATVPLMVFGGAVAGFTPDIS